MKIKTISVVLMSLVSALAFMSQAKACPPCPPHTVCSAGKCGPVHTHKMTPCQILVRYLVLMPMRAKLTIPQRRGSKQ